MSQYYLMAQLPSLDGLGEHSPLPISESYFYELCGRFLGPKEQAKLQSLTLMPPRDAQPVHAPLLDKFQRHEQQLRLALGAIRAASLKKSFDPGQDLIPPQLTQTARTAMSMEDPLAAERYLNQYRLGFLEGLRPLDGFCDDAVYYYGLKLKLLLRMRRFDPEDGMEAYRNIYSSILHGDGQENV